MCARARSSRPEGLFSMNHSCARRTRCVYEYEHAKCMLILFIRPLIIVHVFRIITIIILFRMQIRAAVVLCDHTKTTASARASSHDDDSRARHRWANGAEWRAKELVDGFPLWRVLGNPSMGNLFVKNRPLSGPPRVHRRRRRDENNNINLPPPPPPSRYVNLLLLLFSTTTLLLTPLPFWSNYPVCLVFFLFLLFPFHYVIYSFVFFFFTPPSSTTSQLNSNGFRLNDDDDGCYEQISIKNK